MVFFTDIINLWFCYIAIFLDQPWSAQEIHQMRGRLLRQPQQHEVICIHLLAKETSDIIVDGMAQGKKDMLEAFLTKDAGKGLLDMLTGGGEHRELNSDEEEEEEELPSSKRGSRSSKAKPKSSKAKSTLSKAKSTRVAVEREDEDEDEESDVPLALSIAPGKHQRRKTTTSKTKPDDAHEPRVPSMASNDAPRKTSSKTTRAENNTRPAQKSIQQKQKPSTSKHNAKEPSQHHASQPEPTQSGIGAESEDNPCPPSQRLTPISRRSENEHDPEEPSQHRTSQSQPTQNSIHSASEDIPFPFPPSQYLAPVLQRSEEGHNSEEPSQSLASQSEPTQSSVVSEPEDSHYSPSLYRAPVLQRSEREHDPEEPSQHRTSQSQPTQNSIHSASEDIPFPFPPSQYRAPILQRSQGEHSSEEPSQHHASQSQPTPLPGDEDIEYQSEAWAAQTEMSPINMSTRSSSRVSDISMEEHHCVGDLSMSSILDDSAESSSNRYGKDVAVDQDSDRAARQGQKRDRGQMATPPSPTLHRGPRPRTSGKFNDHDTNPTRQNALVFQQSSKRENAPLRQPSGGQIKDNRGPTQHQSTSRATQQNQALLDHTAVGRNPSYNKTAQEQPVQHQSLKPIRDPGETFKKLLGRQRNTPMHTAGSSSMSTLFTNHSKGTAHKNSASDAWPTSDTTTPRPQAPLHRKPMVLKPVTAPPPLPPKQSSNPFARKSNDTQSRR